ncbi:hypothetical protein [Williamsia sterculiae]|uniref:Uncharacterized membrane protein n=1 Tax=Williamsia sterculiae TaxID=1344003 RepID=A0A1N7FIG1_9NOCA|nr:hypothetical protein [Williamsia sterculiae]SIS00074.1 Uncharacterized membrane protein [Williamsia sterculiae]
MSAPSTTTDSRRLRAAAGRARLAVVLPVSLLATLATMVVSYLGKAECGGPPFDRFGRSAHFPVGHGGTQWMPCYSDIMYLWVGRDINNHVFPYIHGGIGADGKLFGGVVEYPVLSGLLMYFGASGAHTDSDFLLHSAILLAPFGLAITVLLAVVARWHVLWWAATPPLILYSFHNWELPVAFTVVLAVAVMAWGSSISPRTGERRIPLLPTASLTSVILAVGFCLKLYPGLFILPLAVYVLLHDRARRDWRGGFAVLAVGTLTVVAIQVPFMVAGFDGWKASLSFQGKRKSDVDTNSIWYWGLRHFFGGQTPAYNSAVGVLSPIMILAAFALAVYLGYRVHRAGGAYPWIGVSASMLAAFILFHKVHSPQYTLWILPFFVLLRVRWPVIAAYLIGDLILDSTIFRLFGIYVSHSPMKWWVITGVNVGVWIQVALLAMLIVVFVRSPLREPLASVGRRPTAPDREAISA